MYRINDPMCNMYFHVQSSGVHMYATYTTLINTIGILIISLEDMIQALKTNLHKKIDKRDRKEPSAAWISCSNLDSHKFI